jgi:alkylation response protein AidB-like acyl-CoA dehydrogenase
MAVSRTHQVVLDGLGIEPEAQVGGTDFYLARPGFLPGGIGVAACWVGGAARVVDLLHRRHSRPSPGQQFRLGLIRSYLTGAAAMVRSSARLLDDLEPLSADHDLVALAAETRSVAADAVRRIIAEARLTTGPAGLALDQDISHAIPDLELYVSQHNVDADATVLGDPARRPG